MAATSANVDPNVRRRLSGVVERALKRSFSLPKDKEEKIAPLCRSIVDRLWNEALKNEGGPLSGAITAFCATILRDLRAFAKARDKIRRRVIRGINASGRKNRKRFARRIVRRVEKVRLCVRDAQHRGVKKRAEDRHKAMQSALSAFRSPKPCPGCNRSDGCTSNMVTGTRMGSSKTGGLTFVCPRCRSGFTC
jgi:hypothetical protein